MTELHHPVVPTRSLGGRRRTPTRRRRDGDEKLREVIAFGHVRGGGDDEYAPRSTGVATRKNERERSGDQVEGMEGRNSPVMRSAS